MNVTKLSENAFKVQISKNFGGVFKNGRKIIYFRKSNNFFSELRGRMKVIRTKLLHEFETTSNGIVDHYERCFKQQYENGDWSKVYLSKDYGYLFNMQTGSFVRFNPGNPDALPKMSPFPEILDIEISTICHGISKPCKFCYKVNGPTGKYMSVETYQKILDKLPHGVTQIAFGVGDIDYDLLTLELILKRTRERDIIPNITINGSRMTTNIRDMLAAYCGSVAVSYYGDNRILLEAVTNLLIHDVQTNIHVILSHETVSDIIKLVDFLNSEPYVKEKLNALVLLLYKPKGTKYSLTPIRDFGVFKRIVDYIQNNNIPLGMDSCSAPLYLKYLEEQNVAKSDLEEKLVTIEPCESGLFSMYINVNGDPFPCSFTESALWFKPMYNLQHKDITIEKVWNSAMFRNWRDEMEKARVGCKGIGMGCTMAEHCRRCPSYRVYTGECGP